MVRIQLSIFQIVKTIAKLHLIRGGGVKTIAKLHLIRGVGQKKWVGDRVISGEQNRVPYI